MSRGSPICDIGVPASNSACEVAASCEIMPVIWVSETMVPSVGASGVKECADPSGRAMLLRVFFSRSARRGSPE